MVKRSVRILWELFGGGVVLAAVAAGVLVWRAAQGPVPVDFLTPYLARELNALSAEVEVGLGRTVLAWQGWPETFALRVRDVRLTDAGGHTARIPAVDLRLSVAALVQGTVAPTRITTRGADVTLVRGAERLRLAPPVAGPTGTAASDVPAPAQPDVSRLLPRILDDLMAAPDPARRLSYLNELRIRDAAVRVRDRRLGTTWQAPEAAVTILRTAAGLAGRAELALALDGARVPVNLSLSYRRGADSFLAAGAVDGVAPAQLARRIPALPGLEGVTLPVAATGFARIDLAGNLRDASLDLAAESGTVDLPRFLPAPLPVRNARLHVVFDRKQRRLVARDLRVAFGTPAERGPTITGMARAVREPETGKITIRTEAEVADLAANALPRYWPPGIQESGIAREWVTTNVRDGTVHEARVSADLSLPGGDPAKVRLHALDGRMRYSGLSVRYLPGPRPVRGISGTARFDAAKLAFDVARGGLRGVQVRGGRVVVSGLDTTDQFLSIDLETQGPLADSLAPLAHPRIDLLDELGIKPAQTAGSAEVSLAFDFPLLKDLAMDQVDVRARAELKEAAVSGFLFGHDLTDGRLSLDVDTQGMKLRGPLQMAGIPVTMAWTERFDPAAEPVREVTASVGALRPADLGRLGYGLPPFREGPVSVDLHWRGDGAGTGRLTGAANVKDARLAVPPLRWRKPAGTRGHATFDVELTRETPTALRRLSVVAGDGETTPRLEASADARLDRRGRLQAVRIPEFRLGGTRLRDLRLTPREAGWRLDVGGGRIDAAPYLDAPRGDTAGTRTGDDAGSLPGPALTVATRAPLDHVRLGANRRLNDVRVTAKRNAAGSWTDLHLDARVPPRFVRAGDGGDPADGPALSLDYAPRDDGRRGLRARAGNTGALLRALGAVDNVTGGNLTVTGRSRTPEPGSPMEARVELSNFKLRDAPVLAKIFSVAFLTGIGDMLEGEGLSFRRLSGEVVRDGATLRTNLLHAYGPAIGVTAEGAIDLDARTADLSGVIVPAALINRVIGAIPLLGPVITGGEGQGLIAVSYRVAGDLGDPDISVNPFSALAPGFLRNIFGNLPEGGGSTGPGIPDPRPGPDRQKR